MTPFMSHAIVSMRRSTVQASVTPTVFCFELRLEGRIQKGSLHIVMSSNKRIFVSHRFLVPSNSPVMDTLTFARNETSKVKKIQSE